MVETILLIAVVAIIAGVIVAMVVKSIKKKNKPTPSPTPIPTQRPPKYTGFLNNVETVIRNNLSEDELKIFFESIKEQYVLYRSEPGFIRAFDTLLAKYNVTNPF